jgi:Protein of unknown function (DUF1553)/Protein of unknown function (DUF1549)/Planctomycete cytochrome C
MNPSLRHLLQAAGPWAQAWFAFCLLAPCWVRAATPEQSEFFEKKIRPVLVEKCHLCHSAESATPMGGLRLDTASGLLKGGDTGPALVPGDPEKSLLIKAISYQDLKLKMPPTGKLSDAVIADFIAWVRMGAPDSRTGTSSSTANGEKKGIDFAEARNFWAFRPVQDPTPPTVKQKDWPRSPIDYFLLQKLETSGLKPAEPADKQTWLRRVTFDLTGLPPAPAEIEAFLNDRSPDAKAKVVDRLLASPHYGERWGRHWLDLVRFAETNGHEFDNDKLDAWRYRDYVIRAFNADVPYNQFVKEQIAGDLMATKRLSPDGAYWESPIGTSFYWFGEVLNSATDSVKSRADDVDTQIDVMGKAFQGLTVACARCHDHKFDPIPTSDYYGLAGVMHSTTMSETVVDSPARVRQIAAVHQKIMDLNDQVRSLLEPGRLKLASQLKTYLLATAWVLRSKNTEALELPPELKNVEPDLLRPWVNALEQARKEPQDIFYPWVTAVDRLQESSSNATDVIQQVRRELADLVASSPAGRTTRGDLSYEDFEKLDYAGWQISGQAFGNAPQREVPPNLALRGFQGQGVASSFGDGSDHLVGSLTSVKFRMPKLFLHVRMAGTKEEESGGRAKLRVTVVADGHKSEHLLPDGATELRWKTVRLTKEIGRLCYIEIVDRSRKGHLVVDEIVLSDSEEPPTRATSPSALVVGMLERKDLNSLDALATAYQEVFAGAFHKDRSAQPAAQALRQALNPSGRLEDLQRLLATESMPHAGGEPERNSFSQQLASLQRQREDLENQVPESVFAMVARDENPADVRLHIRGNHKNLGEPVPRHFLQIVAGPEQEAILQGSGRMQLAEWVASEENPLTARVMVNRIWKHHFGEGLARSLDNFGKTGDPSTHPELLDFLAKQFIASGWSVKAMHRLMVMSSAYQMSSQPSQEALKRDPQNRWLHHMPVRRLEAESIRDSILAVAGTLDRQLYGASVVPHISPYQDGRGKPKSGPLDGDRRRSIYVQVRRNFLTPLFLAFDYPLPISTIGRRSPSTVPSQALIMMNNEFITLEAREWAGRILSAEAVPQKRVERMYVEAFARRPEPWEMAEILEFVSSQARRYHDAGGSDSSLADVQAWSDLGHVLLNSAEFVYVR